MSTESSEVLSQARIIEASLLTAIESCGTQAIATALDIDVSYVSKLKTHDQKINLGSISLMLAVMGFRLVPLDETTVNPEQHKALVTLAELGFKWIKEGMV